MAEVEHRSRSRALGALLDIVADTVLRAEVGEEPVSMADRDGAQEADLSVRPDLRAAAARVEEAEAYSSLARRDLIPTVGLAAVATRAAQSAPTSFGIRPAIRLPFWQRGQGDRDRRDAELFLRREEQRAAELGARMELGTARDRLAAAEQALAIYRSDVLEPALVNRRLLERAREAGRLDLPTTLLLQRQLLESELAF